MNSVSQIFTIPRIQIDLGRWAVIQLCIEKYILDYDRVRISFEGTNKHIAMSKDEFERGQIPLLQEVVGRLECENSEHRLYKTIGQRCPCEDKISLEFKKLEEE